MLPLHTRAVINGRPERPVLKVVSLDGFLSNCRLDASECALWVDDEEALKRSRALSDMAWGAVIAAGDAPAESQNGGVCVAHTLRTQGVVAPGDVIRINHNNHLISVLHRKGARSNSLLLTERCNSYCLMCSQPPIDRDDSHRVEELLQVIPLIDSSGQVIGLTGGEPTLLGADLGRILNSLKTHHPDMRVHTLTNGRRFCDPQFAADIAAVGNDRVMWAVPLYSDAPEIHDFVVQRAGAFQETLHGLLNLARLGQHIELRVVLQQATVPRLRQLSHFITRNLSFVDHVAWMGLEPMGFARPNWNEIWIEPADYSAALQEAVQWLDGFRMETSIYNLPLCVLTPPLRRFATQSISDWKNDYLPECEGCAARPHCCGFFSSATRNHMPVGIRPIEEYVCRG